MKFFTNFLPLGWNTEEVNSEPSTTVDTSPSEILPATNTDVSTSEQEPVDTYLAGAREMLSQHSFGSIFTPINTENRAVTVSIKDRKFYATVNMCYPISFCRSSVQKLLRLDLVRAKDLSGRVLQDNSSIDFKGYVKASLVMHQFEFGAHLLVAPDEKCPYDVSFLKLSIFLFIKLFLKYDFLGHDWNGRN